MGPSKKLKSVSGTQEDPGQTTDLEHRKISMTRGDTDPAGGIQGCWQDAGYVEERVPSQHQHHGKSRSRDPGRAWRQNRGICQSRQFQPRAGLGYSVQGIPMDANHLLPRKANYSTLIY